MDKKVEVLEGRCYWIDDENGDLIAAMWDGKDWIPASPPKKIKQGETNSITTISGSKYNYTVQTGEAIVSIGFDKYEDLEQHLAFKDRKTNHVMIKKRSL